MDDWPYQADLHGDVETVARWGDEHPDAFAGMWFENSPGSTLRVRSQIVVAIVGDLAAAAQELRQAVQHPGALRFVRHTRPYQLLLRVQEEIGAELFRLAPSDGSGAYVSGLGPDIIANTLRVSLSGPSDELRTAVRSVVPDWVVIADEYVVAQRL